MLAVFVALPVLKLERSSDVRLQQYRNMYPISVTLAVLKLETSSDARL